MKKLLSLIAVLAILGMIKMPVFAAERELDVYSVSATTYPVTEVAFTATQVVGDVRIHHIIITNSDATVAQTVTFYELSDATTTITSKFVVDIASTSASGFVDPIQIPFPIPASPLMIHDLSVRKTSTSSTVRVSVFYR